MGTPEAACYDLYCDLEGGVTEIPPHSTNIIKTGVKINFPPSFYGVIFSRSSTAAKGLVVEGKIIL